MDTRDRLPTYTPAESDRERAARGVLRIDGLVARPLLARLLPESRYVRAGSGEWVVPIALADVEHGFVCDELNAAQRIARARLG